VLYGAILSLATTTRLSSSTLTSRNVSSDIWQSKQCPARCCPLLPARGRILPHVGARAVHASDHLEVSEAISLW
jgi:hypothetical protein